MVLGVVVPLVALAFYLAPDKVGEIIAGPNWDIAKQLLLPIAISSTALAVRQGSRVGLRVYEQPALILRLAGITAALVLVGTAIGSATGGASGAAWAFASAHVLATAVWWAACRRVVRRNPEPLGSR